MSMDSDVQGEQYYPVAIGSGMYTSDLPSAIPDGYSAVCYNMVATGDSVENRIGIKRLSFDWKVLEISPGSRQPLPGTTNTFADNHNFFCQIDPWAKDSTKPAFMWGGRGLAVPGEGLNSSTLNLVRAAGTTDANDGFMSVNTAAPVTGICQYGGTIYYSLWLDGVKKITAINWATDAVTSSAIASTAGGTLLGLFAFKDRLWGWNEFNLFYTDIAPAAGLPETWAFAVNRVPFVGPNGAGNIKKIIPLGNRLAVFTTNGLFTLLVEGAPASWIQRVLDSRSISTTSQCAFESKGIIYYVNTQGVWATNTLSITPLSSVIEDQWFLAKGGRCHTINTYEDGMVVSIAKMRAADDRYLDKENCRTFYSKLNPIAWTEWNINRNDLGALPENIGMIWSMTDKIPTYLNGEPTSYVMSFVTDSTEATSRYAVAQLLIMDGGVDQYIDRSNTAREIPVGIYLKTKLFDGGNPYRKKQTKRAVLEVFTSDAEHELTTSWDIDMTTGLATEVETRIFNDFTVGVASNLLSVLGQVWYRRAALNVRSTLQTPTSQIKIKDVAIVQTMGRSVFEQVD